MSQATNQAANQNGNGQGNGSPPVFNRQLEFIENTLRLTRSLWQETLDKRRSINHECGYPETESLTIKEYRRVYDRGGIPNRIVGLWPDESWILNPDLYEDEDPEVSTTFEQEFDDLAKSLRGDSWYEDDEGHPLWEYLNRIDVLSGIGHYGVLLLGIDDGKELSEPAEMIDLKKGKEGTNTLGLDKSGKPTKGTKPGSTIPPSKVPTTATYNLLPPAENVPKTDSDPKDDLEDGEEEESLEGQPSTKTRELLYIRAFDEGMVNILERDTDPTSRRYMQPTYYGLVFEAENLPGILEAAQSDKSNQEKRVHWSRVIHVADNIESNELFAVPRLRTHFNRCLDLEKLLGGSGEMYWRGALPPIFFVTHPELGTDVKIESQGAKDSIEQMINTLQRWGFIPGVTPIQLAPAVSDPSAQIDVQLDSICIKEGCPKRIFLGSERGELASSQDERAWNKRVKRRQYRYVVPRLIVPVIDRLIQLGVLSQPKSYCVKFPDLDTLTEAEIADVALKRTQAIAAFVQGECVQMITERDWWTQEMKVSDDDAAGLVERAMEHIVEIEEEEADMLEEERQKGMEDFEQQQEIIGQNRPPIGAGVGGTGAKPKPFGNKP